jgi:integrase
MARKTKSTPKTKEPIRLRQKPLANGNKSLYLDMYHNGKRVYCFLKLYLIPETDKAAKTANENTLRAANAIKAQKIIELANGQANISNISSRSKMLLTDWMQHFIEHLYDKGQSDKYGKLAHSMCGHLQRYIGNAKTRLQDVDKTFCIGLIDYLKNADSHRGSGKLAPSTVCAYLNIFTNALNVAVHNDIIPSNPMAKVDITDLPKMPESTREYLSSEEVKAMMKTPCAYDVVKQAFMFSCFCGLRYSDIARLTWRNIYQENGKTMLRIVVTKTQRPLVLPLSDEALRWLPERAADSDNVFRLPHFTTVAQCIPQWATNAGVTKKVTFHVARHTFATLMLTYGADLYTTSKLLGHSNVTTTQIYAKIVDAKKVAAVNLVNGMFND